MNLPQRVNLLVNKKKDIDEWIRTTHVLCEKYGWDYHTLIKQPIPFVLDLIDVIQTEREEQKEQEEGKDKKRGMGSAPF